jgi:hypothetical protein
VPAREEISQWPGNNCVDKERRIRFGFRECPLTKIKTCFGEYNGPIGLLHNPGSGSRLRRHGAERYQMPFRIQRYSNLSRMPRRRTFVSWAGDESTLKWMGTLPVPEKDRLGI